MEATGRLHAILGIGLEDQPALAAILRAMMLGQVQELSGDQKGLFMRSGTMHLFAISGLHVSVIALCLQTLLNFLRVPRLPAALVGLTALWLYVDITGASPSAERAFLMCALVIAAFTLRRPGNVLSALAASALFILLVDPMQLFSASFQMSYGIVAVLLLLGVPLAEAMLARWPLFTDLPEGSWRWHHRWRARVWRWFLGLLGIGLATMLASMLTSVQYFRLFTPGALPANLILIPAASVVIGAGFASLLCGLPGFAAGSVLFNHAGGAFAVADGRLPATGDGHAGTFLPGPFPPGVAGTSGPRRVARDLPGGQCLALAAGARRILATVRPGGAPVDFRGRIRRLRPRPPLHRALRSAFPAFRDTPPGTMKSAYELAMERLKASDPDTGRPLTPEQKARLSEIDRVYQGKIAEREIFLQKLLDDTLTTGKAEEADKIRKQLANEKARLAEEREAEKEQVRRKSSAA